jgi:hypothetical protein
MIANTTTFAWNADKWKSVGRLVSSIGGLVAGLIVLITLVIPIWTEMTKVSSIAAGVLHESSARGGALGRDITVELNQRLSVLNQLWMGAALSFFGVVGRSITGLKAAGRRRIRLSWTISLSLVTLGFIGLFLFGTSGHIVLILAITGLCTVAQDYLTATGDELSSAVGQGALVPKRS